MLGIFASACSTFLATSGLAAHVPMILGAANIVTPSLILILCIIAGVGTTLLLPSTSRADKVRMAGGALLTLAALALVVVLVRYAAGLLEPAGSAMLSGQMGVYSWVFSAIALFGAIRVITHSRPVFSALYFILTVFASAGLFVLMWAEFMAAALVLIYAGAILITYVFVIMLASSTRGSSGTEVLAEYDTVSRDPLVASAVGFALMGVLLFVIFDKADDTIRPQDRLHNEAGNTMIEPGSVPGDTMVEPGSVHAASGGTQKLGIYMFRNHAIGLELAGVILTLSMFGAIVIARKRVAVAEPIGGQDFLSTPSTPINDDPHSIPVYGTTNPRQKEYPET